MAGKYGMSGQVSWAIAGRNSDKLYTLRRELAQNDDALAELRIIVADSADKLSLKDMCEQTKVSNAQLCVQFALLGPTGR